MDERRYEIVSAKEYNRTEGERIFKEFGKGNSKVSMINLLYKFTYKKKKLNLKLYPDNLTSDYRNCFFEMIKIDKDVRELNESCQKDEGSVGILKVLFAIKRTPTEVLQSVQKKMCFYWDSKKAIFLRGNNWKELHWVSWNALAKK